MSKKSPAAVRLPLAVVAEAFGLTVAAARKFADDAGERGDRIEIGNLAAHIARATIGSRHHAQAA
jgi:hypothetical protein